MKYGTVLAFFLWHKSQDLLSMHAVLLQAGTSSLRTIWVLDTSMTFCSKARTSSKQSIHCFLKDHYNVQTKSGTKKTCAFPCSKPAWAVPPENVSCYACITGPKELKNYSSTKQTRLGKVIARQLCMATSHSLCLNLGRTAN